MKRATLQQRAQRIVTAHVLLPEAAWMSGHRAGSAAATKRLRKKMTEEHERRVRAMRRDYEGVISNQLDALAKAYKLIPPEKVALLVWPDLERLIKR
jgi:hypothetical protein